MKEDTIFAKTYRIDKSTNVCMIEIALDQYADIFNRWDSAPLERREVNPELEGYLERCSDEIPFRYSIELDITIPERMRDKQKEEKSRDGIKNHLNFKIYLLKKKLYRNIRRTFYCGLAGSLLLGGVAIWQIAPHRIWLSILEQGIVIGGWVLLWEAVSLLFFADYELYRSCRTYKRLRNAAVIFREVEKP